MFVCTVKGSREKALLLCAALVCAAAAVLCYPQAAANGVRRGLALCGSVLIPSLLPFLVLSGFLVRSGLSDRIGRYFGRLTAFLFRLPGCCAPAILIGFCGGYPAGAAAVAELVRTGRLSAADGRRMLLFCVNGGPAFVVNAVGVSLLGSRAHGWLLLGIHWGISLLLGILSRFAAPKEEERPSPPPSPLSGAAALADSVGTACRSLIGMCGFVMAASSALFLTEAAGAPARWLLPLSCLLEVNCGCVAAAAAGAAAPFWLGWSLGFGGLSVHGQIAACAPSLCPIDGRFFRTRLLHGFLSGLLSLWLWQYLPFSVSAFATAGGFEALPAAASWTGASSLLVLGAVSLIGLCRRSTARGA